MKFRVCYTIKSPEHYDAVSKSFYTVSDLKNFIQTYSFQCFSYPPAATFSLGFLITAFDGESVVYSEPLFIKKFLVARSVSFDKSGHLFASVPVFGGNYDFKYADTCPNLHYIDAIINPKTLKQLYPKCEQSKSEFRKYLTIVNTKRGLLNAGRLDSLR